MKQLRILLAVLAVAILCSQEQARALAESAVSMPAFQFTCTTTAQRIQSVASTVSEPYLGLFAWNGTYNGGASATQVFFGASDVTATTKGVPLCTNTSTCIATSAMWEVRDLYCIVAAGTVVITVQEVRR